MKALLVSILLFLVPIHGLAADIDPLRLRPGPVYVLSKTTPVMPAPQLPKNASVDTLIAMLQAAQTIPPGSLLRVTRTQTVNQTIWYQVFAFDGEGNPIAEGWVSSSALIGQTIRYSTLRRH